MTGGIDHVNRDVAPTRVRSRIGDSGVFGQDRDAFFFFEVTGIHRSLRHGGMRGERPGLSEHRIDQRCLSVVDVGNDGDVSHVIACGMSHERVL